MASSLRPDTIRSGFRAWFVGEENSEGEQRAYCPICENPEESSSPSAMFNPEAGIWNCLKGNHGGTISKLARQLREERGWDIRSAAMNGNRRSKRHAKEPPSPRVVSEWHETLLADEEALAAFTERRMISLDTIQEHEIGWDSSTSRYTIPVYDQSGQLVNVRKYRMGAADHEQKFLNLPGHGDARVFMAQELAGTDWVVLAEGELDCLVLCERGYPAVSSTGGAKTFKPEWADMFTDKAVYVAYDADKAGDDGAVKVTNILRNFAAAVYRVRMPEPGWDVTDFFVAGNTAEDFDNLLQRAAGAGSRTSRAVESIPLQGKRVSLMESMSDRNEGEPIELVVSVTGKSQEPFTAPRHIVATCDMQKGVPCERCPLAARNGQMEVSTQPHDPRLMQFVDVPATTSHRLMRVLTGARCGDHVQFDVEQLWRVEELAVQPSVDERVDEEEDRPTRRTVWSVGTYRTPTNEKVRLVGTNTPDPKTGVLKFQAWKNERVDLDIDKFALTEEYRQQLEIFQPDGDQTSLEKCLEVAADLAANVTRIVGRDELHVGMDLVWHSPIAFRVRDQDIDKGWLDVMIIGDTRTGKSEIATRLMEHYRAGRLISCEGVTFAGLIGGVQQIGNRWHMTWGVVPMHDRRLVILDEVSGMGERNVIQQMSSVRSAGIAQITKIHTEQTSARTRLIWISNPQDGGFLSHHRMGGIGALQGVVQANEDIARFDFVMAAARGDVSAEEINALHEVGFPTYSTEDCELLVKWAWSQTRDTVKITDLAATEAARNAVLLGNKYSPNPPLIQAENVRYKLIRIAASLAARTFSVSRTGGLLVKREHVLSAVDFLEMVYSHESLGYGRMSAEETNRATRSTDMLSNAALLMKNNPAVAATLRMSTGEFKVRNFTEFQGMSEAEASQVVATLHDWGLVVYTGSQGIFRMTAELIDLLRRTEKDG